MLRGQLDQCAEYYSGPVFETARRLPIDHFQGAHTEFAADAAGSGNYPFKTVADYDAGLMRADNYARWTDDAIGRMREGLSTGEVLPQMVVQRILPQLQAHFGGPAVKTEFSGRFRAALYVCAPLVVTLPPTATLPPVPALDSTENRFTGPT